MNSFDWSCACCELLREALHRLWVSRARLLVSPIPCLGVRRLGSVARGLRSGGLQLRDVGARVLNVLEWQGAVLFLAPEPEGAVWALVPVACRNRGRVVKGRKAGGSIS